MFVAHEVVAVAAVVQRPVHFELASGAAFGFLLLHGGGKTGFVHAQAALAAHVGGEVQREAEGVVQLERDFARQHHGTPGQRGVQNLHAVFKGFKEAFFFGLEHLDDAFFVRLELRVSVAHQRHQIGHQFVEKRGFLVQLVAVADSAADDAALHIASAFVARIDTVTHQKRGGANVVGNHAQALVAQIGATGFARSGLDEGVKNVDFVVAVNVLQDGGQALQAHAGIDARCRQLDQAAIGLHVELHEHVVPNLNETVTVFTGAAGRAARNMVAVVVKNLGARAAGAGVGHHPEVVRRVFFALVVANAHNTVRWQTDLVVPDVVGFLVVDVDRDQQALRWQAVDLRQQFPTPFERVALEVVAKAPVAQHLEKRVVARGVAHVFQVVVLATGAQAGLHRGGSHITALVGAQKYVLELHHAGVGEHQRWVVAGHERTAGHHGVPL